MPDPQTVVTALSIALEDGENLRTFMRGFAVANALTGNHLWLAAKWRARDAELRQLAGEIDMYQEVFVTWGDPRVGAHKVLTFAQIEALVETGTMPE